MVKTKEKLMIIDGNALIHRSFHALPPTMTTRDGQVVNAVYGFTSVLIKAWREFRPNYIVVTFDRKGPTFRHKQYQKYKAQRIKAPDELYAQIPMAQTIARALGIPVFSKQGFEADDLIGTLTCKLDGKVEKIIVTGDMDTLQLVNEHTKVYTMSRGMSDSVLYDIKAVQRKYQFNPKQIIDYKALRGDPSDNIPGVKGIGEKIATELLLAFDDLNGVYANLSSLKIKPRIKDLLIKYKSEAYLSRDLATIDCAVDIDFSLEDASVDKINRDKIVKIFGEFEFKSLLPRVLSLFNEMTNNGTKADKKLPNKFVRNKKEFKYHLIDNNQQFIKFFKEIQTKKKFTFDTETSGFDTLTAQLLGISFSWRRGEAYYLNFAEKGKKKEKQTVDNNLFNYQTKPKSTNQNLSTLHQSWLKQLAKIFADKKIKKNAHNAKFDIKVLQNKGLMINGLAFDTMLASYLLNPGNRQHSLDAIVFSEFGFEKINKIDLLGKGRDKLSFAEVDKEKMSLYSGEDADFTHRLWLILSKRLKETELDNLFITIELPLIKVLARMENIGIKLNVSYLEKIGKNVKQKIKRLENKIFKLSEQTFNIRSTKQLKKVLFEDMQISTQGIKRTKTGFSTAFDELEKIKDQHKVIVLIQKYRELTKLQNTYIEALPKLINKQTKRIHTSFNQTIAATGRLSSTEPNLQNIPTRTDLGRNIRQAFVTESDFVLVSCDYSQIELRLAAHMSGDKKMIQAFLSGADIHSATAALINNIEIDLVTSQMRQEAKAINFGVLYGQGAHGLAKGADISYGQAKDFIQEYFKVYKGVRKYIDHTIEEARKQGFVSTMFGRRRSLPEINSEIVMVRKGAERVAANTPLQGTAADIIKLAMIEIDKKIINKNIRMLLQVHDELVFEIEKKQAKKAIKQIIKIMENIVKLKVPMKVDVKWGDNWGEMNKIDL